MIPPVILIDQQRKDRAKHLIDNVPAGKVWKMVIKEHKAKRSESQSGLRWFWVADIAQATGETKEEVNFRLKKTFLLPIFERNEKKQYRATMDAVREVYRAGARQQAIILHQHVVNQMRTEEADLDEMTEYLQDIEKQAISAGIPLRRPDDYHLALYGRKAA